ncbi:MAG: MMPL family transporter [bacterium]|nr:MMPL family transporter [bacterium]
MAKKPKEKLPFVEKLIQFIVTKNKLIEKFFIAFVITSIISFLFVQTNYDLTKYLPDWAPTKRGIDLMEKEFGYPGTARVMLSNVSIYETQNYKDKISDLAGVDSVSWLDGLSQVYVAEDFLMARDLSDYYHDGYALLDVTFTAGDSDPLTYQALSEIENLLGDQVAISGPAFDNKTLSETLGSEIPKIMIFGVIFILLVLALTTNSWFEPLLFMIVMGIAIVINMGTNLIFGEISFLSASVAAILQLAVAMDYSIFLLHTFSHQKAKGKTAVVAMADSLRISISSILASGITTVIGFIALALMQFEIGRDMGFVLAKGILCSMATVLLLMPALIMRWHKIIEKTAHRPFIPPLQKFCATIFKGRYVVAIFVLLLIFPAYIAQGMNNFMYGTSAISSGEGSRSYADRQLIETQFGKSNSLLVMFPNTDVVREKKLVQELETLPYVKDVTALATTLPTGIAESFLPNNLTEQLHTQNWARFIVNVKTDSESELAFACLKEIENLSYKYYPSDQVYFLGTTPATYDMKQIISADYQRVNLISILGVALVVLFTFRSLALTLSVMVPIEVAVYFNTALPYLYGNKLAFLGFLMVSSMQLGATVDYSILLTSNYLAAREREADKKKAAVKAMSKSALSIITSGTVLMVCGYALYFISSVAAISDLGRLVGRGAFLSMILVLTLLPFLLNLGDKLVMQDRARVAQAKEKVLVKKQQLKNKKDQVIEKVKTKRKLKKNAKK